MRRFFSITNALALLLSARISLAQDARTAVPRPAPYPVVPPAEFQAAVAKGTRTTTGKPGPRYWQQRANYKLTAKLDVERHVLEGTGRIMYYNGSPDTLSQVAMHLYQNIHLAGAARNERQQVTPGMELRRLTVAGQQIARDTRMGAGYQINGTILILRLPRPLAPGDSVDIGADWAFIVPQNGAGRMGWSAQNLFFLAYWYPQIAVYDDVIGWNRDQYLGTAEFYMGYADYDVTIEAPKGWIVIATGELQNADSVLNEVTVRRLKQAEQSDSVIPIITTEDIWSNRTTKPGKKDRLTWHYTAKNVRDVSFSASKESKWDAVRAAVGDRDHDGKPDYARVDAVYRAIAPLWQQSARYGRHSIEFLSRFTGYPYPWSHMSVIEGKDIVSGGMEYPMMTLISALNGADDTTVYAVTVHELAHMWIPMIVGADETRYGWIDEGTTDFHETQGRKDFFQGSDPESSEREAYFHVAGTSREDAMMRWTDFQLPGAYVVSSYQKPATVLYALRGLIGEDAFLRGLRSFIGDWAFKHPTPWDFFNQFNAAAGRDLSWFWRSWYYETWTLDQAVAGVETHGDSTVVTIEDKGLVPMPVRLTLTLSSGQTMEREIPVETWLKGASTATISVPASSGVTRVEIDAAKAFPDVNRANNVWQK
ncbi:MAG: M1 family metallopeptidase [Gemmatimonadetes bacterium]|nr:M1 family metallopeptidase [Gemmatimonadota bacterium]